MHPAERLDLNRLQHLRTVSINARQTFAFLDHGEWGPEYTVKLSLGSIALPHDGRFAPGSKLVML